MATKPTDTPLDDLRQAFEKLSTQDKTAFVFEATFDTIGQALAETGRQVAEAVESFNLDDLFRWDTDRPAPEPETAAPEPSRTKTAGKTTPTKKAPRKRPGSSSIDPDGPAV